MENRLNQRIVLRTTLIFIFQLSLVSGLVGCGEEELSHPSIVDDGSTDGSPGSVTQDYFSVTLVNGGRFDYVLAQQGAFDSPCRIINGESNQDIVCILDVNEGDLYYHRLKFRANTPAGMCNYVEVANYFFNNYEIGLVDPHNLVVKKTTDVTGKVTACDCDVNGAGPVDCSLYNSNSDFGEATVDTKTCGQPTCIYDYSQDDSDLPNCCLGIIKLRMDTDAAGTVTEGTLSTLDFNPSGLLEGCFGGPAVHSSWPKSVVSRQTSLGPIVWKIPDDLIYDSYLAGLNVDLEVTPNLKNPNDNNKNVYAANYYTGAPGSGTTIPEAISRLRGDRNKEAAIGGYSNGLRLGVAGNDAYEWRCLDEAHEIKNRIRLYVRDWNTYSEWKKYKDSSGTQGDPNYPDLGDSNRGAESSGCESGYSIDHGYCNDYLSWDDITADVDITDPSSFFPWETYETSWPAYDSPLTYGE